MYSTLLTRTLHRTLLLCLCCFWLTADCVDALKNLRPLFDRQVPVDNDDAVDAQDIRSGEINQAVEQALREMEQLRQNSEQEIAARHGSAGFTSRLHSFHRRPLQVVMNDSFAALAAIRATQILRHKIHLDEMQVAFRLPRLNIASTRLSIVCPEHHGPQPPSCDPTALYRTPDGTCNNPVFPWWGSSRSPFVRLLVPDYSDHVGSPRRGADHSELPSARAISSLIHSQRLVSRAPISDRISLMVMQWGQFLDHDISHTPMNAASLHGDPISCCGVDASEQHPDCYPISISSDDSHSRQFQRTCMEFVRSVAAVHNGCRLGPREQVNQVTSFLDASSVYGSTADQTDALRSHRRGQLETQDKLLPASADSSSCITDRKDHRCFQAGDSRVNEHSGLATIHTLAVREHNRISAQLALLCPRWNDETTFQETRRLMGALLQHITYSEWLPVTLGPRLTRLHDLQPLTRGHYDGYSDTVDASISNVFATAAMRFGHTLVPDSLSMFTPWHSRMAAISLHKNYFRSYSLYSPGKLDELTAGLANANGSEADNYLVDNIRNRLFERPGDGFGLDLGALNIQRGRDHGIPSYTKWRKACLLQPEVNSFSDLKKIMNPVAVARIISLYRSVEDIDLYVAGLLEVPVDGGLVGETLACLIAHQFQVLKRGDRFWYENFRQPHSFTTKQLDEIRKVTLAKIVCENSALPTVQRNMMLKAGENNPRLSCRDLPALDLRVWAAEMECTQETSSASPSSSSRSTFRSVIAPSNWPVKPAIAVTPFPKMRPASRRPIHQNAFVSGVTRHRPLTAFYPNRPRFPHRRPTMPQYNGTADQISASSDVKYVDTPARGPAFTDNTQSPELQNVDRNRPATGTSGRRPGQVDGNKPARPGRIPTFQRPNGSPELGKPLAYDKDDGPTRSPDILEFPIDHYLPPEHHSYQLVSSSAKQSQRTTTTSKWRPAVSNTEWVSWIPQSPGEYFSSINNIKSTTVTNHFTNLVPNSVFTTTGSSAAAQTIQVTLIRPTPMIMSIPTVTIDPAIWPRIPGKPIVLFIGGARPTRHTITPTPVLQPATDLPAITSTTSTSVDRPVQPDFPPGFDPDYPDLSAGVQVEPTYPDYGSAESGPSVDSNNHDQNPAEETPTPIQPPSGIASSHPVQSELFPDYPLFPSGSEPVIDPLESDYEDFISTVVTITDTIIPSVYPQQANYPEHVATSIQESGIVVSSAAVSTVSDHAQLVITQVYPLKEVAVSVSGTQQTFLDPETSTQAIIFTGKPQQILSQATRPVFIQGYPSNMLSRTTIYSRFPPRVTSTVVHIPPKPIKPVTTWLTFETTVLVTVPGGQIITSIRPGVRPVVTFPADFSRPVIVTSIIWNPRPGLPWTVTAEPQATPFPTSSRQISTHVQTQTSIVIRPWPERPIITIIPGPTPPLPGVHKPGDTIIVSSESIGSSVQVRPTIGLVKPQQPRPVTITTFYPGIDGNMEMPFAEHNIASILSSIGQYPVTSSGDATPTSKRPQIPINTVTSTTWRPLTDQQATVSLPSVEQQGAATEDNNDEPVMIKPIGFVKPSLANPGGHQIRPSGSSASSDGSKDTSWTEETTPPPGDAGGGTVLTRPIGEVQPVVIGHTEDIRPVSNVFARPPYPWPIRLPMKPQSGHSGTQDQSSRWSVRPSMAKPAVPVTIISTSTGAVSPVSSSPRPAGIAGFPEVGRAPAKDCVAVGFWRRLPGMAAWCTSNCHMKNPPFCPVSHCRCA